MLFCRQSQSYSVSCVRVALINKPVVLIHFHSETIWNCLFSFSFLVCSSTENLLFQRNRKKKTWPKHLQNYSFFRCFGRKLYVRYRQLKNNHVISMREKQFVFFSAKISFILNCWTLSLSEFEKITTQSKLSAMEQKRGKKGENEQMLAVKMFMS